MKMKHVGLYNDGHFGAQSLHLRCGLVSPSSWHHAVRYLPNMQDSVLERWLAFLQTGFSPVELSELSLAHSLLFPPSPGHVHKLERYLKFGLSYHPDDSLKVIDLLSRNTHLIFLNRRLYFQLLSLDQLDNRPGRIRIHPFLDGKFPLDHAVRGHLDLLGLQTLGIYLPPDYMLHEGILDSPHLHFIFRHHTNRFLLLVQRDFRLGLAKIKACKNRLPGYINRVIDLLHVYAADNIKKKP